jgi:uncharacterized protein (DUF111 family)
MKKGRPGTLVTILSSREMRSRLEELLFRETGTLGVRFREERRHVLERKQVPVETAWGTVRIKTGLWNGREIRAAAEYEDCRKIAEAHSLPVSQVMAVALQAYRQAQS